MNQGTVPSVFRYNGNRVQEAASVRAEGLAGRRWMEQTSGSRGQVRNRVATGECIRSAWLKADTWWAFNK